MANQQALKKRLLALLTIPENQICSDCPERQPRWASIIVPPPNSSAKSMGAFCCLECSGSHRRLGVHISFVRSINLDSWNENQVIAMEQGGNKKVNAIYESELTNTAAKLQHGADGRARERYVRDKYERRKYYNPHKVTDESDTEDEESEDEVVRQPSNIAKLRATQRKSAIPVPSKLNTPYKSKKPGRKLAPPRAPEVVLMAPEVDLLDFSAPVQSTGPMLQENSTNVNHDLFGSNGQNMFENTSYTNGVFGDASLQEPKKEELKSSGSWLQQGNTHVSSEHNLNEAAESTLLGASHENSSSCVSNQSQNSGKGLLSGIFNQKSNKKTSEDILSLYNQSPQQGVYNMGLIGSPGSGGVNNMDSNSYSGGNHSGRGGVTVDNANKPNMQLMQQQQQQFMMMQRQMQFQQQMGMMSPMQMQMMNGGGMMLSPQQLQFQQMQQQQQEQKNHFSVDRSGL